MGLSRFGLRFSVFVCVCEWVGGRTLIDSYQVSSQSTLLSLGVSPDYAGIKMSILGMQMSIM